MLFRSLPWAQGLTEADFVVNTQVGTANSKVNPLPINITRIASPQVTIEMGKGLLRYILAQAQNTTGATPWISIDIEVPVYKNLTQAFSRETMQGASSRRLLQAGGGEEEATIKTNLTVSWWNSTAGIWTSVPITTKEYNETTGVVTAEVPVELWLISNKGDFIVIPADYLVYPQATPVSRRQMPEPEDNTTMLTAIMGGVVAGLALVLVVSLSVMFFSKRRQTQGTHNVSKLERGRGGEMVQGGRSRAQAGSMARYQGLAQQQGAQREGTSYGNRAAFFDSANLGWLGKDNLD